MKRYFYTLGVLQDKRKQKVERPTRTPIQINRHTCSEFYLA